MRLKLLALLAPGFMSLLWSEPSSAASFPCSKAQSALEHAICDTPDLSSADDALARAYATALGGLSTSAETALRNGQKAWLAYVDRACTPDGLPAHKPYSDADDACLVMEFKDRELLLEQSRMANGLRLTFVDQYVAAFNKNAHDLGPKDHGVATHKTSYPQIDGTDDEAVRFNAIVSSRLHDDSEASDGEDTVSELRVSTVDPTRITVTHTDYAINHGATHGYYQLTYLHYLRREQRELTAADIFNKPGWQDRLRELVIDALKTSLVNDLIEDDQNSQAAIRSHSVDAGHWDFRAQGLLVQFDQGEVAPAVEGAVSVIIPWELIQDDLTQSIGMALRDGV